MSEPTCPICLATQDVVRLTNPPGGYVACAKCGGTINMLTLVAVSPDVARLIEGMNPETQRLVVVDVCTTCGGEGSIFDKVSPHVRDSLCTRCETDGRLHAFDCPNRVCPDCDSRGVRWTT